MIDVELVRGAATLERRIGLRAERQKGVGDEVLVLLRQGRREAEEANGELEQEQAERNARGEEQELLPQVWSLSARRRLLRAIGARVGARRPRFSGGGNA